VHYTVYHKTNGISELITLFLFIYFLFQKMFQSDDLGRKWMHV